jgi:hypothetical protein
MRLQSSGTSFALIFAVRIDILEPTAQCFSYPMAKMGSDKGGMVDLFVELNSK